MSLNAPQAVIFDMDGTIFATELIYHQAWQRAMKEMSLCVPDSVAHQLVGHHINACRTILNEHIPCMGTIDQLCHLSDVHFVKAISSETIPLKEGVLDLLDYLDEIGLPRVVATNSEKSRAQLKLKSSGLFERFKTVIGGNCVPRPKPAPDIFLKAAEYLDLPPAHCLVLEDSSPGVKAAYDAGMTVLMIPDIVPASEQARAQATAVCNSLFDVIDWIKNKSL